MKHENTEKNNINDFKDRDKTILYFVSAFFAIVLFQISGYYFVFNKIENFFSTYGFWLLYLDISIASIAAAYWYFKSYKGFTSCMASMMIAMTFGMQVGMMIGSVFGAINGYFIGAMVGMILGTFFGIITGRSNPSIMGVVQGMMAGVMGGTMGPMITFMMYADNVLLFMPFYIIINVAILYGFAKMYYDEVIKDNKDVIKNQANIYKFTLITLIFGVILTIMLIYLPKSFLLGS